jgi:hypothetical protein
MMEKLNNVNLSMCWDASELLIGPHPNAVTVSDDDKIRMVEKLPAESADSR